MDFKIEVGKNAETGDLVVENSSNIKQVVFNIGKGAKLLTFKLTRTKKDAESKPTSNK